MNQKSSNKKNLKNNSPAVKKQGKKPVKQATLSATASKKKSSLKKIKATSLAKKKSTAKVKPVSSLPRKPRTSTRKIIQVEDFVYRAQVEDLSEVYLVGTAHVSKKSVELVEKTLNRYRPDVIYLELDGERKKSLLRNDYRDLDVLKIIKSHKILYFIFYLVMSFVQKKIAEKYGTRPGGEFLKALEWAESHQREVVLIDRNAQVTVKRAWRSMSMWEQIRFLFSGFVSQDIEEFDVEKMQEDDLLSDIIKKLGIRFPGIKRIVIDERDAYMTHGILSSIRAKEAVARNAPRKRKIGVKGLAVVGAGHLEGMKRLIHSPFSGWDEEAYLRVPPAHRFWQIMPWFFTLVIVGVFVAGFWYSDWEEIADAFLSWALITGGLSALGAVLAGGHPLTVLTAAIGAPITTLHPILGVGFFTAVVQFYFAPPRVKDFETLSLKLGEYRSWWKNRITRIFLVFLLSSLGAGFGMWIALSKIISNFA